MDASPCQRCRCTLEPLWRSHTATSQVTLQHMSMLSCQTSGSLRRSNGHLRDAVNAGASTRHSVAVSMLHKQESCWDDM